MTVQEAADAGIKTIRRPNWIAGRYIELSFDVHKNLAAWGMLIEAGEPKRRIDVVGIDDEDFVAYKGVA